MPGNTAILSAVCIVPPVAAHYMLKRFDLLPIFGLASPVKPKGAAAAATKPAK